MRNFNQRLKEEASSVMMDAEAPFELRNIAYQLEGIKRLLSRVETELVALRVLCRDGDTFDSAARHPVVPIIRREHGG